MATGSLVDERGRIWPDRSWELARRLGHRDPTVDLVSFCVRERGFIHIRPQESGVHVALRPGCFSLATLGGALFALKEIGTRRILLALFSEGEWLHEFLAGVWEFAERAEYLTSDGPVPLRSPWLAAERTLRALSLPHFAHLRPLMAMWREMHGRLPGDLIPVLRAMGLSSRAVLVRQSPHSSRLVIEHFGAGINFLRPCEALEAVGRDFRELPDHDYGAWLAAAYTDALARDRPRIDAIRAMIRTSGAATLRARYDRMLMPWRGADHDRYTLAISVRREVSVA